MKKTVKEDKGQAVVEYAIVLGLIAAVLIMFFVNHDFQCAIKSMYIQSAYKIHLTINDIDDSEAVFNQFMIENGLDTAHYEYSDGRIHCSQKPMDSNPENPDPEEVPYLWLYVYVDVSRVKGYKSRDVA